MLLDAQTPGVLFDGAFANAFYVGQIRGGGEGAVDVTVGDDGFGLALANAIQAGQGGDVGGVDVDGGGLGVGEASLNSRTRVAIRGVRFMSVNS